MKHFTILIDEIKKEIAKSNIMDGYKHSAYIKLEMLRKQIDDLEFIKHHDICDNHSCCLDYGNSKDHIKKMDSWGNYKE